MEGSILSLNRMGMGGGSIFTVILSIQVYGTAKIFKIKKTFKSSDLKVLSF